MHQRPYQKYSFTANWKRRGSPAVVIRPKLAALLAVETPLDSDAVTPMPCEPWAAKLVWLIILNASPRISNRIASWIAKMRLKETSNCSWPGRRRTSRPRLPKVPGAFGVKALGLRYCKLGPQVAL